MRTYLASLTLLCLFGGSLNAQRVVYLSPNGSDRNPGTEAAPLRSVDAAQAWVRQNNASGRSLEVVFAPGRYELSKPMTFRAEDGGLGEGRVVYRANGEVVLSGGRELRLQPKRREGEVVIYGMRAEGPFRQLYVNGQRAQRARHPNAGYLTTNGWDFANNTLTIKGNFAPQLAKATAAELFLIMSWTENYLRLADVKVNGASSKYTTFHFAEREGRMLFERPYPVHKESHRALLMNAPALVDSPGEWYYDPEGAELHYFPRPGEDPAGLTVVVPELETMVDIAGTATERVQNLSFTGFTFAETNWDFPSREGYLNIQAGLHAKSVNTKNDLFVYRPPAAVEVAFAKTVRFERNRFYRLGAGGLDLAHGTERCAVKGNHFAGLAGGAVFVGKFTADEDTEVHVPYLPSDLGEVSTGDTIGSNLIEATGQDYFGTVGIAAGYPRGLVVAHNVLRDMPYSGISVGYGWTQTPNAMQGNTIAYNDISGVMRELNDGAGIYTLSLQPGTVIHRNHVHDIAQPTQLEQNLLYCVYFDEQSGGTPERPMIFDENILEGPPYLRLLFNQPTNLFLSRVYANPKQGTAPAFFDQVGLEAPYRDLLSRTIE